MATISVVLGACAFEPGAYTDPNGPLGGGGGGMTGGGGTGGGSTSPDAGAQATATCDFDDPNLRLCIDFEDRKFEPMVTDLAPFHLPSTGQGISETSRDGKRAAGFYVGARIDVDESGALDISGPMSIELWVYPGYKQSANLLQNQYQYQLQLNGDGKVGCSLGNASAWSRSEDGPDPFKWTHVACVFDGSSLQLFVDGSLAAQSSGSAAATGGTTGTRLGGNFGGALDDIRIYARALSILEACTHAGKTSCAGTGGGGDREGS